MSILRRLKLYMLGFVIMMGIIFPIYANFFVEWKEGMVIFFVIGCLLAGLTVGLVSFWFVKVILLKKLKEVSKVATDIENNNLQNLIELTSNDDVGNIVNGINKAIFNIRELFDETQKVFAVSEIALSSVNNNEDNNSALDQINESINCVTDNTKRIDDFCQMIDDTVTHGREITNCTIQRQTKSIEQVRVFSDVIESLAENSKRISKILEITNNITSQTKILSVNASVEAAHAGEAGKGFAIVAAEIRKFAADSENSAKTISESITLMHNDIERAKQQINEMQKSVSNNNKDVNAIDTQFSAIYDTILSSKAFNEELKTSVAQLNNLFGNVKTVFSELSDNLEQLQQLVKSYEY